MIKCYTENNDWLVEVDGHVCARFAFTRFGYDAVYAAARYAAMWRRQA